MDIEDDIDDTKETIWDTTSSKRKRFQGVLLRYSKSSNYDKAILEWEEVPDTNDLSSNTCICSQNILDEYYIRNRKTDKVLVVGSECISKFGNDDMKESVAVRKKIKKYDGTKLPCFSCGSHTKKKENAFCKKCCDNGKLTLSKTILEEVGTKKCLGYEKDCDNLVIATDYSGFVYCSDCFEKGGKTQVTFCQCCGTDMFDDKFPRCIDCFKNQRSVKCLNFKCKELITFAKSPYDKYCPKHFVRVCKNSACGKEIEKTRPANHIYCCWSCRPK